MNSSDLFSKLAQTPAPPVLATPFAPTVNLDMAYKAIASAPHALLAPISRVNLAKVILSYVLFIEKFQ